MKCLISLLELERKMNFKVVNSPRFDLMYIASGIQSEGVEMDVTEDKEGGGNA